MRTSFLVMNLENNVDVFKLNTFIKENIEDYELVVACNEEYKGINELNVIECVFDKNEKPDSVINKLIPTCSGDNLVLIRKIDNNDFKPIKLIINNLKKENDVVVIKRKTNKFIMFFKSIFGYFVRFLYGYNLINSNLSVVGYGKVATNVLKELDNCATYTKIDKWVGIDLVEVDGECPKVKLGEHKWTRYLRLSIYFAVFITLLMLRIFMPNWFTHNMANIFSVFFMIFMVLLTCVDVTICIVSAKIGGNNRESANLIRLLENNKLKDEQDKKEENKEIKSVKTKTTKPKPQKKSSAKTKKVDAKNNTTKIKENKNGKN